MQLIARWGSPYPGGVLYVFNNEGQLELVGTDIVAEMFISQLWMANNWDPVEAGQYLAEQAVLDSVAQEHNIMIDQDLRKVDGNIIHSVGQNAVNRRRGLE